MQTRLCTAGVYDSDEGRLIRLAIAFSRVCLVAHPIEDCYLTTSNVLELEAKLCNVVPVMPGIWEVHFCLLHTSCTVSQQGSLAELAQTFCFKPSSNPSAPRILERVFEQKAT
jgi:hypothetical protein